MDIVKSGLFWDSFLQAIGTEPRPARSIQGASGIHHWVLGIGVDDTGKRVALVAAEGDARTAAMMQGEYQKTLPDVHVIVARPVAFGLASMALRAMSSWVLRSSG